MSFLIRVIRVIRGEKVFALVVSYLAFCSLQNEPAGFLGDLVFESGQAMIACFK